MGAASDFQHSVLEGMRSLLGFQSGANVQGISSVDREARPVLDVGRFASYGSGIGRSLGWHICGQQLISPIGGANQSTNIALYGLAWPVLTIAHFRRDFLVWYYGSCLTLSQTVPGEFTRALVGYLPGTDIDRIQGTSSGKVLGHWSAANIVPAVNAAWGGFSPVLDDAGGRPPSLPIPLFGDGNLIWEMTRSAVVGAVTVNWESLLWAGRRGAVPPGL